MNVNCCNVGKRYFMVAGGWCRILQSHVNIAH